MARSQPRVPSEPSFRHGVGRPTAAGGGSRRRRPRADGSGPTRICRADDVGLDLHRFLVGVERAFARLIGLLASALGPEVLLAPLFDEAAHLEQVAAEVARGPGVLEAASDLSVRL